MAVAGGGRRPQRPTLVARLPAPGALWALALAPAGPEGTPPSRAPGKPMRPNKEGLRCCRRAPPPPSVLDVLLPAAPEPPCCCGVAAGLLAPPNVAPSRPPKSEGRRSRCRFSPPLLLGPLPSFCVVCGTASAACSSSCGAVCGPPALKIVSRASKLILPSLFAAAPCSASSASTSASLSGASPSARDSTVFSACMSRAPEPSVSSASKASRSDIGALGTMTVAAEPRRNARGIWKGC